MTRTVNFLKESYAAGNISCGAMVIQKIYSLLNKFGKEPWEKNAVKGIFSVIYISRVRFEHFCMYCIILR